MLLRLSVFAGGWSLEAAEKVCAGEEIEEWEILDVLTTLCDKSLVVYEEQQGEARYRLLETVRQYGRDGLVESGEADAVPSRHCEYFLSLVQARSATLSEEEQEVWRRLVHREYDNVRAALDFCLGDSAYAEVGLRAAIALTDYWELHFLVAEGYSLLEGCLSRPQMQGPTLLRARALLRAAHLAQCRGEYRTAIALLEEGLPLARQRGDGLGVANCLGGLGGAYFDSGQPERARPYYEEGLAAAREMKLSGEVCQMLSGLSNVCRVLGEYEAARRYAEEMVALNTGGSGWPNLLLANAIVSEGRLMEARERYLRCLSIMRSEGEVYVHVYLSALERLTALAVLEGRWDQSARLLGACEAYREAEVAIGGEPADGG